MRSKIHFLSFLSVGNLPSVISLRSIMATMLDSISNCRIFPDGTKKWLTATGVLHNLIGPALITTYGVQIYYFYGKIHRDGGPAIIFPDGTEMWYQNDRLHRIDGPAVEHPKGALHWVMLSNDKYILGYRYADHRVAAHQHPTAIEFWYEDGFIHRGYDAPAVTCEDGTQVWYNKGIIHRGFDRPAVVKAEGTMMWYKQGQYISTSYSNETIVSDKHTQ